MQADADANQVVVKLRLLGLEHPRRLNSDSRAAPFSPRQNPLELWPKSVRFTPFLLMLSSIVVS